MLLVQGYWVGELFLGVYLFNWQTCAVQFLSPLYIILFHSTIGLLSQYHLSIILFQSDNKFWST